MKELLGKYFEGKCSPEEFYQIVNALKSERTPAELSLEIENHWYSLSENSGANDEEIDFRSILDQIHHEVNIMENSGSDKRNMTSGKRIYTWSKAAAVIVLVLLSAFSAWYIKGNNAWNKEKYNTISSSKGQHTSICLPDGSKAYLNGESTLKYTVAFGKSGRRIELTGEAYFEVSKNKKPFIVSAGNAEITALGTSFNVDAYNGPENLIVTLETGKVKINKENQYFYLHPGQQAVFEKNRHYIKKVDTEIFTSWRKGILVFKDETLLSIITRLEKLYDVRFEFKTEALKKYRYRGAVSLDNSVLEALEMLKVSTGIVYEVQGNLIILKLP